TGEVSGAPVGVRMSAFGVATDPVVDDPRAMSSSNDGGSGAAGSGESSRVAPNPGRTTGRMSASAGSGADSCSWSRSATTVGLDTGEAAGRSATGADAGAGLHVAAGCAAGGCGAGGVVSV